MLLWALASKTGTLIPEPVSIMVAPSWNSAMVSGTGLGELCHVAVTPGDWINQTEMLMKEEFTRDMRNQRNHLLKEVADNDVNARKIIETIDGYNPEL